MFEFALLCFALLCFALLCFALLCFALLCFALLYPTNRDTSSEINMYAFAVAPVAFTTSQQVLIYWWFLPLALATHDQF
jgi:hypothetical protein